MNSHQIAFVISGTVHLGLLVFIFANLSSNSPENSQQKPLSLSLQNFTEQSSLAPVPEVMKNAQPTITPKQPGEIRTKSIIKENTKINPRLIKEKPGIINNENKNKLAVTPDVIDKAESLSVKKNETPKKDISQQRNVDLFYRLEQRYASALKKAIESRKYYPAAAKRRESEGEVVVGFSLDRMGGINNIHIIESSTIRVLDRAALNAVQSVGRFKPFPSEISRQQWRFEISLSYKLL